MSFRKSIETCCLAATLLSLSLASGCGPKGPPMGTVAGKLTIGDAPPKDEARVTFINNSIGQGAGATIQSDGSYSLDTPLPLAEYKVFVSKVVKDSASISTAAENLTSVPKPYRSEETSPLKYTIKEGKNEINIEIPAVTAAK